jgi:hypothetical protein
MRIHFKGFVFSSLALLALIASVIGVTLTRADNHSPVLAHTGLATGARSASAALVAMHSVNMQSVPAETTRSASHRTRAMPLLTGTSAAVHAQRKAAAASNKNAPVGKHAYAPLKGAKTNTPGAITAFQGMSDSASTCPYFGGCQPPDQALAASKSWVFQGVNTSFAVYSTGGVLQTGWPKSAQSFFHVPSPGSCDPNGPFLSDPRAFYDPNDGRFWAATLQVEGAFGLNSCPFATRYWIAVSKTSDPRGSWNVYAFDMSLGTTNAADYTQFGFDAQAIYFTGNMFNQAGTAYQYAEILGVSKSSLEHGHSTAAYGFYYLTVGGIPVDTVQPVETEAHSYSGPLAGLFINSFNINFGSGQCSGGCSGVTVWAMAKPGTSSDSLTGVVISTASYALAPLADQPSCTQCIETLDTRISGTPVYHNGLISFALETGVSNGSQVVPGIFWAQVSPVLDDSGVLTGASVLQEGYYFFTGDGAAYFGTLMTDADGNLFMVFEFSNSASFPGVAYTARRVTYSPGSFRDVGIYLRAGDANTFNSRWGDFEATSYDGVSTDNVWFSGQYSNSGGDWSTYIGEDKFSLTAP